MQERDAAIRFIKEVLPQASVSAKLGQRSEVIIASGTGVVVWKGAQRDLYRKYGWPAKADIQQRMQMYKEDVLGIED